MYDLDDPTRKGDIFKVKIKNAQGKAIAELDIRFIKFQPTGSQAQPPSAKAGKPISEEVKIGNASMEVEEGGFSDSND